MPRVVLATAGYDHTIRFWEASSGVCYRTLQFPENQVNCLKTTPDKQYIAAAGNPVVKLFEVETANPEPVRTIEGHSNNVTTVGFQKDAKWMYTGSEDGTVKIWDLRAPGFQRDYGASSAVNTVELHPNQGELISGDSSGTITTFDLTANKVSGRVTPVRDVPIQSLTIAADATHMVAANTLGDCYFWAPHSGGKLKPCGKLSAHRGYILKCRLSPDSRYLATASSDRTVKIWSMPDKKLSTVLTGHGRWVWDALFSADSSYVVTASSDNTARLWSLATGACIRHYSGHHKAVVTVALNDGVIPTPEKEETKEEAASDSKLAEKPKPDTAVTDDGTASAAPGAPPGEKEERSGVDESAKRRDRDVGGGGSGGASRW